MGSAISYLEEIRESPSQGACCIFLKFLYILMLLYIIIEELLSICNFKIKIKNIYVLVVLIKTFRK
jgi:hypothetical protein